MISRALLIALFSAYATSLTPIAPLATPGDDDCALYLTGPGRSSAYDYSLNLLKGNFAYDGQHTCITYEAINQAYLDARSRILVSQPKGDWHAEDFASVGELILDISISLARTYGLTYEEIEKGLPLIDTSRTLIREVCPPVFSHVECRAGKYRRLDGLCNNLQHPTWGATMAPFQRLIGPLFADGINAPRIAHTGRDLPLSRVVSRTMHPDDGFHDHAGTVMVIAWGQFMDHDYTLTGTPLDPINRNDPEECCKRPPHLKHPYCNEIRIPDDDYFYRLFGVKCIDFVRGFPSPRPGCKLGSRVPFNTLTGAIDGNTVYGVTEKFSRKLRTGYGGLLRMNPVFKEYGLKDLLPLKLDIPDEGCTRPNKNMYCFEAGEIRVNEQLVLTVMHTLMAREHNRVAKGLAAVNPHWDDETLFQEARRINIAEIQHITYNEFLPILLGKDVMEKFGLVLEKEGYWNGYDPEVNADVIDAFASAAYRFGHSLLPTAVERWSKAHKFIASKRLSDLIRRPYDLYRAGVLDEYVMGLMNQVAQAMDDSITQEVTNHLFKKVGARFGMDLVSLNMQRGREFGIPGYMEFRKFCGLSDANTFQDLFGSMPNETLRKYETIFEHPIDIDLWSGGVSERPLRGSMLGPTFACIIATQFSYSRRGDRFWFELPHQPSSFTPEQLTEIKKSRLARVICDNTDIIDTVQVYPFVLPDHELNPRVPCRSGILPSMDFSKWAEPVPFGAAKQYITEAVIVKNNPLNKQDNVTETVSSNTAADTVTRKNITQNYENTTESINKTVIKSNTQLDNDNIKIWEVNVKPSKIENSNKVVSKKSTGHYKNSLRKRRSTPLIYDYVTHHSPKSNGKMENEDVVLNSSLADFLIKTSHDRLTPSDSIEINQDKQSEEQNHYENNNFKKTSYKPQNKKSQEIDESSESSSVSREGGDSREISNHEHNNNDDSRENKYNGDERDEISNLEDYNSREVNRGLFNKDKSYLNASEINSREIENIRKTDITRKVEDDPRSESNSSESDEEKSSNSKENTLSEDRATIKFKQPIKSHNSEEDTSGSNESIDLKIPIIPLVATNSYRNDNKNNGEARLNSESNESEEKTDQVRKVNKFNDEIKQSEEIDKEEENNLLDVNNSKSQNYDLTTSKIKNNDPNLNTNVSDESNDDNSKEAFISKSIVPKVGVVLETLDALNHSLDKNNSKLRNIHDDEVKPVKELNEESTESNEESDELLLFENLKDRENRKYKDNKKDLKLDVERIPLDYKYIQAVPNKNVNSTKTYSPQLDTKEQTSPKPQDDEIDENLNIKFSDISIKLPEIKLPDDVLFYNYNKPAYPKQKTSISHNDESGEDELETEKTPYEHDDDNYTYTDTFNKNYKTNDKQSSGEKDDSDEDEDLYEKFVRERFGNRRLKEAKNSKYIKPNKELFNTIQNVLKKTEKIQQEAEKSGDPNAGYAWTLEYGENL
ncbi:unnamed protein product [Pieris brassicae]|uniref:Chorion peroxidase n=1 Tax=Pieris brassicae TaxID=7116 RepID=A0A9P0SQQ7_PIEBR|nr:unnamed protein product [Pieris brassicae]